MPLSLRYLTSCFATIRSNNFENIDRLEIGRNDLRSAGSRSAFFSKGVMYADRKEASTTPDEIDALIRRHINGASSATLLLRSHECDICHADSDASCHDELVAGSGWAAAGNLGKYGDNTRLSYAVNDECECGECSGFKYSLAY